MASIEQFDCKVRHIRLLPRRHEFSYPAHYGLFSVGDQHRKIRESQFGVSIDRFNVFSIHRKDYLDRGDKSLKDKVRQQLEKRGFLERISRIELLTSPRYFGYSFNPVSFFFCYSDERSRNPRYIIVEINNTFSEKHLYFLDGKESGLERKKTFHVSPFFDLNLVYKFHFQLRDNQFSVQINLMRDGQLVFHSSLVGQRTESSTIKRMIFTPLLPWLTMPRILWQAAKLYYQKGLPVQTKPVPSSPDTIRSDPDQWIDRVALRIVRNLFRKFDRGELQVIYPDRSMEVYRGRSAGISAILEVRDYRFFRKLVLAADIGFGEAFTKGDWHSPDPVQVLRFFIQNRSVMSSQPLWISKLDQIKTMALHLWRSNRRAMSRKNIEEHYDLSNQFFESFLDSKMQYSCGVYPTTISSLEEAQSEKIRRLTESLQLTNSDHVLEIGCGWGGLAISTVRKFQCRWTGITLSSKQKEWAERKVREAGLSDLIEIKLLDYRDLKGSYTKAISVEMLEAVGHENLNTYFKVLDQSLAENARVAIQVISMPESRYSAYRRRPDWIQKHIFPGGLCPSLQAVLNAAQSTSSFRVDAVENIGPHYATTLSDWTKRFEQQKSTWQKIGFDEEFYRKWRYYFAYCEAAFRENFVHNYQIFLQKEAARHMPK
ncbi:MAG: DUF1365 family protein [Bradymonadales bacterium]|nr:MAG: DUF1365 family protein [Bradymonadales bacterium]